MNIYQHFSVISHPNRRTEVQKLIILLLYTFYTFFLLKKGLEISKPGQTRITSMADKVKMISACFRCIDAELKDLEASVTSPSGETEECEISEVRPGEYCIKFVPKELGVHTVSVKHRGFHIPGRTRNSAVV